jgi:hypothetical protein
MKEVMFTWDDGPNAAAEFHRLYTFAPDGEPITPRMTLKNFHKNGKWSYSEQYVYVPSGSVVITIDQSTHGGGSRVTKMWVAVAGRPCVFEHRGEWRSLSHFPQVFPNEYVSQAVFEKILRSPGVVAQRTLEQWDRNADISQI